jgi:hypothetical protein
LYVIGEETELVSQSANMLVERVFADFVLISADSFGDGATGKSAIGMSGQKTDDPVLDGT